MSNFPALLTGPGSTTVPWHVHAASEIVGPFGDIIVSDIRSIHWDGGSDLSGGMDLTATTGYFLDSSAGAIQAGILYWRGGAATVYPAAAALTLAGPQATPGERTDATVTPAAGALALTGPQAGCGVVTRVQPAAAALTVGAPQTVTVFYPTVRSSSSGAAATTGTGKLVLLPATIEDGDLLLVFVAQDDAEQLTAAADFTRLFSTTDGEATSCLGVFWRACDGTEAGTWLPVSSTDPAEPASFICYAVAHAADPAVTPPFQTHQNGFGVSPDPTGPTPPGGPLRFLWIAVESNDSGDAVTAWPANYTANQINRTGGWLGASIAAACRQLEAATENPGAFTLAGAEGWVACTVAVYPE